MHPIDDYANGRIGILDIGGTILINTSNHLNPSPMGTERFEGVQTLIKIIAEKINSTKLFTIEKILREGSESGKFIYKPSRNTSDMKDISVVVQKSIEDYTRFTVSPLITGNFPDIEDADFIVITGGGANIIDKASLLDEIGHEYFDRLVFIESSELANVRGFYKFAILSWGSGEEISNRTNALKNSDSEENKYSNQLKNVQRNLERIREEITQEI